LLEAETGSDEEPPMVPIRDENESYTVPYVTYALIALNVLVFLYETTLGERALERFFYHYAVVPKALMPALGAVLGGNFAAAGGLLPLLTAMFLHGGILHIAGNMLYLWIFGDNVEERMGHVGFLLFYLFCGVIASLVQSFFNAGSAIPSLGASGAIAGVLGAYIVKFPNAQVRAIFPIGFIPFPFRISAVWFLGFWFLQQALNSFASLGAPSTTGVEQGGVAYLAHASGFVAGVLIGLLLPNPDPYRTSR
jgi:membrane associated rhomboid family serine protease